MLDRFDYQRLRAQDGGAMHHSFPSRPTEPSASKDTREAILVARETTLPRRIVDSLKAAGFAVVVVEGGDAALHFMGDSVPAAVLLGWSAENEPYHLIRRIRAHEHLAFVQIVVLTSHPDSLTMGRAITAGADDCMDTSRIESDEIAACILARISRARSQAELAFVDPLTGVNNRRFMNDRLAAEIARAVRAGTTLSIALVDLDDFKHINDTLGHSAGDRALALFASVLRASFRTYDTICRFGGDEFIALFPDCDCGQANARLDELRGRLEMVASDPPLPGFTAGIAMYPGDGTSWEELFETADRRLREGKKERGRKLGRATLSRHG
jgi:diguanylate cyclase (GGDEF)-like protein